MSDNANEIEENIDQEIIDKLSELSMSNSDENGNNNNQEFNNGNNENSSSSSTCSPKSNLDNNNNKSNSDIDVNQSQLEKQKTLDKNSISPSSPSNPSFSPSKTKTKMKKKTIISSSKSQAQSHFKSQPINNEHEHEKKVKESQNDKISNILDRISPQSPNLSSPSSPTSSSSSSTNWLWSLQKRVSTLYNEVVDVNIVNFSPPPISPLSNSPTLKESFDSNKESTKEKESIMTKNNANNAKEFNANNAKEFNANNANNQKDKDAITNDTTDTNDKFKKLLDRQFGIKNENNVKSDQQSSYSITAINKIGSVFDKGFKKFDEFIGVANNSDSMNSSIHQKSFSPSPSPSNSNSPSSHSSTNSLNDNKLKQKIDHDNDDSSHHQQQSSEEGFLSFLGNKAMELGKNTANMAQTVMTLGSSFPSSISATANGMGMGKRSPTSIHQLVSNYPHYTLMDWFQLLGGQANIERLQERSSEAVLEVKRILKKRSLMTTTGNSTKDGINNKDKKDGINNTNNKDGINEESKEIQKHYQSSLVEIQSKLLQIERELDSDNLILESQNITQLDSSSLSIQEESNLVLLIEQVMNWMESDQPIIIASLIRYHLAMYTGEIIGQVESTTDMNHIKKIVIRALGQYEPYIERVIMELGDQLDINNSFNNDQKEMDQEENSDNNDNNGNEKNGKNNEKKENGKYIIIDELRKDAQNCMQLLQDATFTTIPILKLQLLLAEN